MTLRNARAAASPPPDVPGADGVRLHLGIEFGDAANRVSGWRDAMAPTGRVALTPEEADRFTADMVARRFDDLMAVRVEASDHRLVRTRAMAAARPLDHVLVNVTQAGCVRGRTGRRRLEVGVGAMAVQRLSSPMNVRFEAAT